MPPGQTIPMDLSYVVAKKVCSQQDLERLACAYLASTQTVNFDAEKAAREFGGTKAESFKRSIWVITKKIKEYKGDKGDEGDPDDAGNNHGTPVTPKANGGRKRKADSPMASVKTSAKKGKKPRAEEAETVNSEPAAASESESEFVLT